MDEASFDPRNEKAVKAALDARWEEAVYLNLEILEDFPNDVDALNRLGRAYVEMGNITKARSNYQKVLKLDPYNSIAANNLKRLANLTSTEAKKTSGAAVNPDIFLEEPGKTKVIELTDLAMKALVVTLRTGDAVNLIVGKNGVTVVSNSGKRIGRLPQTWGQSIAEAVGAGSEFSAVIKAVTLERQPQVTVFVREEKRSPKAPVAIFQTDSSNFTPYIREEAFGILANQSPIPTDTEEGGIEEIEIKDLPAETSLESYKAKELEESGLGYDEDA